MKIFSASQIRSCDAYTIKHKPVESIQLMERAAKVCVDWMVAHLKNHSEIAVFCGSGNNGGDGFAIARILYQKGFDVNVFIESENQKFSDDALHNFERVKEISGIDVLSLEDAFNYSFKENTVIVDALLGSGLNRKIEGKIRDVILFLNDLPFQKIAIDIPSGLYSDDIFEKDSVVFQAEDTLSFQFWKKAFLHPETGKFCGEVHILDIGLNKEYIEETSTNDFVIDEEMIHQIFQPRQNFSHKGTYGKCVIIGGSFGKMGASVLATKSALKTGSGLTFSLAPKCGYEILQTTCPEAMYLYGGEDYISSFEVPNDAVCGIGPGLGTDPETEEYFIDFLNNYKKPLVLDADTLNIISKDSEYLKLIPQNSIITPHPKEFERLFSTSENSFERLELAKQKASELKIFIVLKDHHTQIITPEKEVFYNITGNSGMAKGGSGDVLTGMITSLLAQKYSSKNAAIFGVWLHGKAGDFAAEKHSKEAMLPSDLIDEIGNVFKILNKQA
ncbi:NAD(P)H-hydrate dehydratase [uncultured Chryseobacterium sp.]|uniref:NAD(P)H-hydrate dehydratase n=1 Tax=uncultured Chryseobacterium sp. TaxID=259322 RepID=UPI00263A2E9A|nr:NAD(P)H-hydrate dehydratase [uncultured Chryseobacterium sp.]